MLKLIHVRICQTVLEFLLLMGWRCPVEVLPTFSSSMVFGTDNVYKQFWIVQSSAENTEKAFLAMRNETFNGFSVVVTAQPTPSLDLEPFGSGSTEMMLMIELDRIGDL